MIFDTKSKFKLIFEPLTHHVGKLFSAQVCNGSCSRDWLVCRAENRAGSPLAFGFYPPTSQKNEKTREKTSFFEGKEKDKGGHPYIFGIVPSPASDSDANISRELPLPGDISHFKGRVKEGKIQG
jgi:hypothetical protein